MMIQQALKTAKTLLPLSGSVTMQQIEVAVMNVMSMPVYQEVNRDELFRELQVFYNIRMDDFRIIEADERKRPWLNVWKADKAHQWVFWERYRNYLQSEKNFANEVVGQLDKLTDRTLDGLFDPAENIGLHKYGLVVGQVQSGKTANYTGLICKAADAGFKLIIVLAGIHSNLRSQTQLRLDEGFLGFDTQHQRAYDRNGIKIGVGNLNPDAVAHSLTSSLEQGDFTASAANSLGINFSTNEPILAVVKKNARVLERLRTWLGAQADEMPDGTRRIRSKSLLLIDDEADNASINTNREAAPVTRINGLIKEIIRLFDKSGYVGYTATPFANIFIPIAEDELFPRDFIINIPAPSNYIGPDKIFGTTLPEDGTISDTVLPVVNRIDDFQDFVSNGHRREDGLPGEVPGSLKTAIKCFIMTCAIRRFRGQRNVHNSMLVHVSRYTNWQGHIRMLTETVFDFYRRGLDMKIPQVEEEFRRIFEENTEQYLSYRSVSQQILDSGLRDIDTQTGVHEWEDIRPCLAEAADLIQVREINGGSGDALNYYDHREGLSVIAVGGDKLSRGLTLEGLSVSYYLRASRMYDTLMQMGRWFGYRSGYVDLCRLFTSRELNEWFCHITLASEELREEFDYMSEVAGSTPEQYALRVRTHPGVLQISASNKIRYATEVEVSWSGRLVETYQLSKDAEVIHANLMVTEKLVSTLDEAGMRLKTDCYLWRDVPAEVLYPFFRDFRVAENLKKAEPQKLLDFIRLLNTDGELVSWRVGLMSKRRTLQRIQDFSDKHLDVGFYLRREEHNTENYYIRKAHIISPGDEFIDLIPEEYEAAMQRTRQYYEEQGKVYERDYPRGEIVRNEFRTPQEARLLIYLLEPAGAGLSRESDPITGFAVSFPKSPGNRVVRYAVHEQLLPMFNTDDEEDFSEE